MQYGAMNFPVKPVSEELDRIHDLGFDYFELTLDPPCAHYSDLDAQTNDLVRKLSDYGMDVVCHLPSFVYTADLAQGVRNACIDEMVESIRTASKLHAVKAVLHPSLFTGLAPLVPQKAMALALDTLDILVREAGRAGLVLCFENMYPQYHSFFLPDHFKPVFEKHPGLQMTLDTGHANIDDPEGTRLSDFIRRWPERIGHVHVSDNRGRCDDHLKTGNGNVDFNRFAKLLRGMGYDGTITFEIFSPDPVDLVQSRDHIDRLLRNC